MSDTVVYGDISATGNDHQDLLHCVVVFFNSGSVSVGTYCRKAQYLLMKLCQITKTEWRSYTIYRSSNGCCSTILYTSDGCGKYSKIELVHKFVGSRTLRGISQVANSVLLTDKWLSDAKSVTVTYTTNCGDFSCTRSIYSFNSSSNSKSIALFTFTMSDVTTGMKKLFNHMRVSPKQCIADPIKITKCVVVSSSEEISGTMPVDILDVIK